MHTWTTTTDATGEAERLDDAWRYALAAAERAVIAGGADEITVAVAGYPPVIIWPVGNEADPGAAQAETLQNIHKIRGEILARIDVP